MCPFNPAASFKYIKLSTDALLPNLLVNRGAQVFELSERELVHVGREIAGVERAKLP